MAGRGGPWWSAGPVDRPTAAPSSCGWHTWPASRPRWRRCHRSEPARSLRPVADRRDSAGGVRPLLEEDPEAVVVEDRRLHLHGLVVLAARIGAHDHEA